MVRIFFTAVCIAFTLLFSGCPKESSSSEKPPAHAKVENAVKETDLTTVTLTSEAVQRLGIELAIVEKRSIEKHRTYGGDIVPVSGKSITVTAPLPGTLLLPEGWSVPVAGMQIKASEPLYNLLLAFPQQDILTIQEEVALKQAEVDLAEKSLKRAQQLLEDKAGSEKDLEQAQAQLSKSAASLEIAKLKLDLLQKGEIDSAREGLSSVKIRSPIDGIIQKVHAASGQTVTASDKILEITNIDPVWIKVPVYVGDLPNIDPNKQARVHSLEDFAAVESHNAKPVKASFSANPQSATVDIFYELSNKNHLYRPGQKVSVTVSLKTSEQNLVVPYSSIVFDMYGGAWVYENTQTNKYVRRRVELNYVLDGQAVLSRSPAVGAKIVSAGAAELFGTEFGVGK